MYRKVVIFLVIIGICCVLGQKVSAQEKKAGLGEIEITQKLDEILANQEKILSQLEQIKQELAIIKVRATR